MGAAIELRMCDDDRTRFGGPEWVSLDLDRLIDLPASTLERWEEEAGYAIELACAQAGATHPPAKPVRILVWLARKQGGDLAGGIDEHTGRPESFARLAEMRTMQVRIRDASTSEPEADANPPAVAATPPGASPAP